MRWFWIDRFEEFVRGTQAVAIKNVSLAEEHLHDHFPGLPLMPNSLVVEGMAQTAGLLVADAIDFNRRVVLAKVAAATFHFDAEPGDTLRFEAGVLDLKPAGSLTKVTSRIGDQVQGEAELFFAHLEPGEGVPTLFSPEELTAFGQDERGSDPAAIPPLQRPFRWWGRRDGVNEAPRNGTPVGWMD
jgi:3-hydroxyacyl-[acyl-carrier-protein] dehydratase